MIQCANEDPLSVKDLTDLVPDRVVNALHIQLGGQRLLHAIDNRQFSITFLSFFEQTLGLIEEARILERGAQRCSDGGQQTQFGFPEGILTIMILYLNPAKQAVITNDRNRD